MSLDKSAIEKYAVNAVEDSINISGYLSTFIADNDKEPSWDGHIYIYEKPDKRKDHLTGRISVQVKGTEQSDHALDKVTFRMEACDLRNYLNDGGIILFVVYVKMDVTEQHVLRKVFYSALTPVRLLSILAGLREKQKTTLIEVKTLPSIPEDIATIVLNCYQDCKKQASFTGQPLQSLEQLEQSGILESVSTSVTGYGIGSDYIGAYLHNDTYMYAKVKGCNTLLPLSYELVYKVFKTTLNNPVSVQGKCFYEAYDSIRTDNETTIRIGEGFTMSLQRGQKSIIMHFKSPKKMKALIRDMAFMIACFDNHGFEICGYPIHFNDRDIMRANVDVKAKQEALIFWQRVSNVFILLHCSDDLDVTALNNDDLKNLDRLCMAFLDGQLINGLKTNLPQILLLDIGTLRFVLTFQEDSEKPGTYRIGDYFSHEIPVFIKGTGDEHLDVPQYIIFHKDEFLSVSNMRFEVLLPAFQKYGESPYIIEIANSMLLDLISAFDLAEGVRRKLIFDTAVAFADWLLTVADNVWDKRIALLNKLQLNRRVRNLDADERVQLYEMAENEHTREDILVGIYLLLGEQDQANRHFEKLDRDMKEAFVKYPIYHFWIH